MPRLMWLPMFVALCLPVAVGAGGQEDSKWEESGWIEEREEEQGIPARGTGDMEFNLDAVTFLGTGSTTITEFFLEVPYSQLTFVESEEEEGYEAVTRFELTLKSTETGATASDERVVRIRAASEEQAAREDVGAVIISRFSVEPGLYAFEAKLTDLQARKWQLVALFRGARKGGVAKGYFRVRDLRSGLQLADPVIARKVQRKVEPSPYSRGELGITPNPSHVVGLFQPTLTAYLEVYSPWEGEGQQYSMTTSVVSRADGAVVASRSQDLSVSSPNWGQVVSFDMGEIPSGSYVLRVEVRHDSVRAAVESPIEVLWQGTSWNKPESDLLQEMSLALTEEQLREFKRMSPGERERFLAEFWRELDPTPGTAVNEVKEEFERRIAYANAHYSETRKGIYTDRGMIYIRYGQPDDIKIQVMPVGDSSLDRVLGGDEDRILDRGRGAFDEEDMLLRRPGDRRAGGMTSDQRAYEIWYYDLRGRELFPSQRATPKRQAGMKFVFVDEGGYGNFVLRLRTDE